MRSVSLATIGAVCAVITVVGFVIGIVLMASSGVQVLIPETGADGLDWIADAEDAGDQFVAGAAVVVFAGMFALVAFLGFYDALRQAGPWVVIAPIAGVAGMVLVTISHATPIALATQLVPDYTAATGATKEALAVQFDTWAQFCLLMNYFGDMLAWGVTTPLFAIAILKTRAVPRWIGWVGLVSAFFGGWLGLLWPISDLVNELSTIGFFAFFVFLASFGIALLLGRGDRVPSGVEQPVG
jgi:uncharacterized protein DUF4386